MGHEYGICSERGRDGDAGDHPVSTPGPGILGHSLVHGAVMTGLATVVARIRGDLNRGSDFDARIKEALQNAIQFYRARRYGFNTRTKNNFSISTEYTSLTYNVLEVDYCKITVTSFKKELIEENYLLLSRRARDLSLSDEPQYFAIQDRLLRVYPAPDKSYSVSMHFLMDLTNVSLCASDSASNAWLTEGYDLIKTHAMVEMLEVYIGGDEAFARADRLKLRETDVEAAMKRRANIEQGSGRVRGVM
jgi:hypothetical protein